MAEVYIVKESQIQKIVSILRESVSYSQLCKKWSELAIYLEIEYATTQEYSNRYIWNQQAVHQILSDMLIKWHANNGSRVQLVVLLDYLINIGLRNCAEDIQAKIEEIRELGKEKITNVACSSSTNGSLQLPEPPEWKLKDEIKPLRGITVQRAKERIDRGDGAYKLPNTSQRTGFALILNIDSKDYERRGAAVDTENLINLLPYLGYTVLPVRNAFYSDKHEVEEERLSTIIQNFKTRLEEEELAGNKPSSILVFVGAHGYHNEILASDKEYIKIYDEIIHKFNHTGCITMRGRPKIFLFQSCRPPRLLDTDADSQAKNKKLDEDMWEIVSQRVWEVKNADLTDTLIAHACPPKKWALRDAKVGSLFVYALCKAIMENAHNMDLATMISDKVSKTMLKSVIRGEEGHTPVPDLVLKATEKIYYNLSPEEDKSSTNKTQPEPNVNLLQQDNNLFKYFLCAAFIAGVSIFIFFRQ